MKGMYLNKGRMDWIERGDVVVADLGGKRGSEQGGIRPCLVIQNDIGNEVSPTIIVAPITSAMKKRFLLHVDIKDTDIVKGDVHGTILCEQIRTLDKCRITIPNLAKLGTKTMNEVNKAILNSLALN